MNNVTSLISPRRRNGAKNKQFRALLALVSLLIVSSVIAHAQHSIPFASPSNTIELTVGNVAAQTAGTVEVEMTDPPAWITAHQRTVRINELAAGASSTASFTFGVEKSAPVEQETALHFTIRSQSGEVWQKQVMIRIAAPAAYELQQNYPNPFNPSTTIGFSIPKGGMTSLRVYDVAGREVAELMDEFQPAGYRTISFDASKLSSGVYLYTLTSGSFRQTKRMVVVK